MFDRTVCLYTRLDYDGDPSACSCQNDDTSAKPPANESDEHVIISFGSCSAGQVARDCVERDYYIINIGVYGFRVDSCEWRGGEGTRRFDRRLLFIFPGTERVRRFIEIFSESKRHDLPRATYGKPVVCSENDAVRRNETKTAFYSHNTFFRRKHATPTRVSNVVRFKTSKSDG